jgi:hypothetical protein
MLQAPRRNPPARRRSFGPWRSSVRHNVEGVFAEDRRNLQRVGKFVGALAPAHRMIEQASDIETLVPEFRDKLAASKRKGLWVGGIAKSRYWAAIRRNIHFNSGSTVLPARLSFSTAHRK